MTSELRISKQYRLCACCSQLIVLGEMYLYQSWAPWEQEDRTSKYYISPSCRWCGDRYWKWVNRRGEYDDRLWMAECDGCEWVQFEMLTWLSMFVDGVSYRNLEDYRGPLLENQVSSLEFIKRGPVVS